MDGLTYLGVRQLLEAKENGTWDFITLTGCSGHIWGAVRDLSMNSILEVIFEYIGILLIDRIIDYIVQSVADKLK